MADRPILFSGPMVRALLDGKKTQTRRVHFTQTPSFIRTCDEGCDHRLAGMCIRKAESCGRRKVTKAAFSVRDRLWVREAHYLTDNGEFEEAVYAADEAAVGEHLAHMAKIKRAHPSIDWSRHERRRPSIHMPRWASRMTLTVTEVRVQRLQDISNADAFAEGVEDDGDGLAFVQTPKGQTYSTPRGCYGALWDGLNAKRGFEWATNPWVVALTFTVLHQNIDALGAREAA